MSHNTELFDCIVIGAGAAGLTAAIYLARFKRKIQVIDGATSRLLSIPTSHNYPAFVGGIHGSDLLQRLRMQLDQYEASVITGTVQRLDHVEDGNFFAHCGNQQWRGRTALLATGVVDVEPPFVDVKRAVAAGCVRYCPVCDGFEATGKKVAVLGKGKDGLNEALFLRHFTKDVTLLSLQAPMQLTEQERERLEKADVRIELQPVVSLRFDDPAMMYLRLQDGNENSFNVVYAALGTIFNSGMAQLLGASCTEKGELIVDAHQQTSIPGLYAAGDIVLGLNQITVAMGQAAISATAIHNRLRTS